MNLPNIKLMVAVSLCLTVELLYQSLWLGLWPSRAVRTPSPSNPFVTFAECRFSEWWSYLHLAYKGLGLAYAVFLIGVAKELPKAFNEAKYIALSVYNAVLTTIFGGIGL